MTTTATDRAAEVAQSPAGAPNVATAEGTDETISDTTDTTDAIDATDVDACIAARRELIDEIDSDVIRLIQQRKDLAAEILRLRVGSGGPRLSIDREGEIISRYRSALGKRGAEMAHLVLNVSRGSRYEPGQPPAATV